MRGKQSRRPRAGRAGHRPLLTFRLDGERRQRVRARLAGEGRTMSEVVILGLELYVQHKLSMRYTPAGTGATPPDGGASPPDGESVPPPPGTTAVASVADLVLPDHLTTRLREMRESGQSDLLSATLAGLYDAGWPLRPLAQAVGISRQAVQARIRQQLPAELRAQVPECPPPSAFPRRRPARAGRRRPHLTVKIDHALRAAAHREAGRNGHSLSQVVERILDHYLHSGLPAGESREIELGDTTPTRPARRSRT